MDELSGFVQGFKSGYEMIDSPEEKEEKRAERKRKAEEHSWRGEQRGLDNEYRSGRAARSDMEWDEGNKFRRESFDWQKSNTDREFNSRQERYGVQDEQWTAGAAEREEDRTLRRDDYKLRRAEHEGASGGAIDDMEDRPAPASPYGDSEEPTSAIPDDSPEASYQPSSLRGGSQPMRGPEIAQSLVSDLQQDFGMPQHIAVGIVGQLAGETGGFKQLQELNPVVKGSRGGGGYAQWTGPRRRQFESFAQAKGLDPKSYEANYRFLRYELANTSEGSVLKSLRGARNEQEAGRIFTDKFLRPGIPNHEGRARWTNRVSGLFGGGRKAVRAARGGLVEETEPGSMDDDDPLNDRTAEALEPEPEPTAIPEDVPAPTPRPAYAGAAENEEPSEPDVSTLTPYERGRRAVREGLKRAIADNKLDQSGAIDDPELEKQRQRYLKGYGGAPNQMMRQVIDKIDPDRKMPPAERNMLAMGEVYNFYMDRGEPGKAQEAAKQMVQYYRGASQRYIGLAQAAAQSGDMDRAAKAAIAAYANIPDGRDFSITKTEDGKFDIEIKDGKSGKSIHKEIMDPKTFAAAAMKFSPATFDDAILDAAGAPAEKYDDASLDDVGKVSDAIKTSLDEAIPTEGDGGIANPKQRGAIADVAASLATVKQNQMSPEESIRFTTGLLTIDPSAKEISSEGFKTKAVRGNPDLVEVTATDGRKAVMTRAALNQLRMVRGDMVEGKETEIKDNKASEERWKSNMELLDRGRKALGDAITEPGEASTRVRDAGAALGRAAASRPVPPRTLGIPMDDEEPPYGD